MDEKICELEDLICGRHSNKFYPCGRMTCPSFRTADVASTSPKYKLGKVAFSSMFLKRKYHNVSGPHLFLIFTTHAKKSLPPLGRSYSEQQNHFAIGRNSERCSYHTGFSRFVLPISDPSALNFSQFVGFQNSPKLKNRKSYGNVRI